MPKNDRSAERPLIGKSELQKFRFELDRFAAIPEPPDNLKDEWAPQVKAVLSDERLKGHFGYRTPDEVARASHDNLRKSAGVLLAWVERWVR